MGTDIEAAAITAALGAFAGGAIADGATGRWNVRMPLIDRSEERAHPAGRTAS